MEKQPMETVGCSNANAQGKYAAISTTTAMIILLCLKLVLANPLKRGIVDYCIWLIALFLSFVYLSTHTITRRLLQITSPFIALFILQLLGLLQGADISSLVIPISTLCAWGILFSTIVSKYDINGAIFSTCIFAVILFYLKKTLSGEQFGNTIPGCLVFLITNWIVLKQMHFDAKKEIKHSLRATSRYLFDLFIIFGVLFICFKSSARTSLFTLVIMIFAYIAFTAFPKLMNMKTFYFIVLLVLGVTVFYINIRSFWWYNEINQYSIKLFGKNIDSSRPYLWQGSLQGLKWWQWIIGAGTNRLANIEYFIDASFHNSFIQLLMQNGLLGLMALVMIFKRIWSILVSHAEDTTVRMVLAAFIGIIVLNSFETALLQNKAFLGIFQWIVLGLGVNRCFKLDQELRDSNCSATQTKLGV